MVMAVPLNFFREPGRNISSGGLSLTDSDPPEMEASDLSSPGSTAQQCTGVPSKVMACLGKCDVPGGRSLPATVGTFVPGARHQARPSCRAFVHSTL